MKTVKQNFNQRGMRYELTKEVFVFIWAGWPYSNCRFNDRLLYCLQAACSGY